MSATFDATTTSEYSAASTASARSAVIVAALTGTVSVKVFNGSNVEMGSGTMAAPWATASGATVAVGEVSSFAVGTTATPDANWYIRFQDAGASRWVRGSFGLSDSTQDFTWSLATWEDTQTGTIGTATIITTGNSAPVFTVAPEAASIAATGGTIQFTATDADSDTIIYSLTTTRNGITINSSTGLVTVTTAAVGTTGNIVVSASDGILSTTTTCSVVVSSDATRVLFYDGSFSSAGVPSRTSLNGGGFVRCKYEPEGNVNSVYNNTSENTTASNIDCRVLTTETWNGETIRPRSGTHFMRQAIYYTKQYEVVNGGLDDGASPPLPASSLDKPRVMFDQSNSVYQFEWDQEVWHGFSIFLPLSHVGDIATKGNAGGTMVWVLNADSSFSQMILDRYCATGETSEKWWFNYQVNADAVADLDEDGPAPKTQHVDLGVTSADRGKWTDFVFRYRLNPFSTTTNASSVGGKNQVYQGNKGILQIWKGTGAVQSNGNRTMTRFVNLVNTPIGGVPHSVNKLQVSHRMYKYGWKKNATTTTYSGLTNPGLYHGWDEIRWGFGDTTVAASKGQSRASVSSDVSPSGEVLT